MKIIISILILLLLFDIIIYLVVNSLDNGVNIKSDKIIIYYNSDEFGGYQVKYLIYKLFFIIPCYKVWSRLNWKCISVPRIFLSEKEALLQASINRIKNKEENYEEK